MNTTVSSAPRFVCLRVRQCCTRSSGKSAFALLLVLVLLAALGGAVLGAQLMLQQRLRAAEQRNRSFQASVLADAAVIDLLRSGRISAGKGTNIWFRVSFPPFERVAIDWKPSPAVSDAWMTRAIVAGAGDTVIYHSGNYVAWRRDGHWRMSQTIVPAVLE